MPAVARLPRVNALLLGVLRASDPPEGLTIGSRIPAHMPLPYLMATRAGGSSIHPEFLDQALVDVQTWAPTDAEAESIAQWARDALYRASRYPQLVVPGVGSIAWFDETVAPREIPSDLDDHDVYRYQGTYALNTRPYQG